jgi:hypothetical protein
VSPASPLGEVERHRSGWMRHLAAVVPAKLSPRTMLKTSRTTTSSARRVVVSGVVTLHPPGTADQASAEAAGRCRMLSIRGDTESICELG